MLSNTILMSTENVKFYQPGPTFPGSIRKSIYRGYIPKNLVPSVRAHEEPGPKCPGSIGSLSTEFTFLRTWSQVSRLTESLVPSVLAEHWALDNEIPQAIQGEYYNTFNVLVSHWIVYAIKLPIIDKYCFLPKQLITLVFHSLLHFVSSSYNTWYAFERLYLQSIIK